MQKMFLDHENHNYPDKPHTANPEARADEWVPQIYMKSKKDHRWSSYAAWYMNNYEPNFSCQLEKRTGIPMNGDGAKWVCDPHRITRLAAERKAQDPNHPGCVVYSIGSRGDFTFELGLQKEVGEGVCEYHIFDMGAYKKPSELRRSHYHRWGLEKHNPNANATSSSSGGSKQRMQSLLGTIKQLGHENLDVIDIFVSQFHVLPLLVS